MTPPCSGSVGAEDKPKFYSPSPSMVTSVLELSIFERDESIRLSINLNNFALNLISQNDMQGLCETWTKEHLYIGVHALINF